ncbi:MULTISPECIES: hypothetical protein, partial [Pirellulaceae]|uniref:hypothetical protein n=1 Tax=Pirellulaceae TaxID=2691357 RepID=UPI001BE0D7C2
MRDWGSRKDRVDIHWLGTQVVERFLAPRKVTVRINAEARDTRSLLDGLVHLLVEGIKGWRRSLFRLLRFLQRGNLRFQSLDL